jgi:hypothetical protein
MFVDFQEKRKSQESVIITLVQGNDVINLLFGGKFLNNVLDCGSLGGNVDL